MSNVLDPFDQYWFIRERATGATLVVQCIWVYDGAIDIDGLRQFHRHLQRGRLSRRIERSPLPFGRHRWVLPDHLPDLEVVASARPRDEFDAWLNEQANTPLDAEHGPGWHLAVLPFTDGGGGVSFVFSHCLADGGGLCEALEDAVCGRSDPISWPAAGSRRRWRALREDARQTARDIPAISAAVVAAARWTRRNRGGAGSATPPPTRSPAPPVGADEPITLPVATIFVDADEWDTRAHSLGGTSNALLVGLAARLGQRLGRVTADGLVTLAIPVNERTADDTRANAVSTVTMTVDPARATTDLHEISATFKQALIRHPEVRDKEWALMPLLPLVPKRLIRRTVSAASADATSVSPSNLGAINPAINRPDGTDADYFAIRPLYPGMTQSTMHCIGGVLAFVSGKAHGRVFVSVLAYQPGNSNDALHQALSSALADFSLSNTTGWRQAEPVREAQ